MQYSYNAWFLDGKTSILVYYSYGKHNNDLFKYIYAYIVYICISVYVCTIYLCSDNIMRNTSFIEASTAQINIYNSTVWFSYENDIVIPLWNIR